MGECLQHLTMQDAPLLLRNSFAIPKLFYIIRSSPSFLSPSLQRYDETLRSIVSDITNINLDEAAWTQVSLPAKSGRLGIRSSVQLAPSAFHSRDLPYARTLWSEGLDLPSPAGLDSHRQKAWDTPKVSANLIFSPEITDGMN